MEAKKGEDKRVDKSSNTFEDMEASDGSSQLFVSSTGAILLVVRAKVAVDALQMAGQLSDNTMQQVSKDHRVRVMGQHLDETTRPRVEDVGESTVGDFTQSYGMGRVVQQ